MFGQKLTNNELTFHREKVYFCEAKPMSFLVAFQAVFDELLNANGAKHSYNIFHLLSIQLVGTPNVNS